MLLLSPWQDAPQKDNVHTPMPSVSSIISAYVGSTSGMVLMHTRTENPEEPLEEWIYMLFSGPY